MLSILQRVHLDGDRDVHAAEVLLCAAAACDALSSFFELRHLAAYASNGVGSHFSDALSAYFEALCDALLAALTLCIAAGWTLASRLGDDEKAGRGPLRDETPAEKAASAVAPLARLLRAPGVEASSGLLGWITLHLVLAQWSRWEGDDFDSFHDFEHWPGKLVVVVRVVLFLVLIPVALRTQACADETTFSVKMNGASAMEITTVRGQLLAALDAFYATRPRGGGGAKRRAAAGGAAPARTLKRFK